MDLLQALGYSEEDVLAIVSRVTPGDQHDLLTDEEIKAIREEILGEGTSTLDEMIAPSSSSSTAPSSSSTDNDDDDDDDDGDGVPDWRDEDYSNIGHWTGDRDNDGMWNMFDGDDHVGFIENWGKGSPVIMDLDGDGVEVSLPVMTFFDMDDDGYVEQTAAWAGPDDGFLVIDLNADGTHGKGDGKIDQTSELVLSEWGNAGDTDLQALARAFDNNKDGVLNDKDTVWNELKIWQDLDQDGVTDKNELKTLSQLGITKINLTYDDGSAYSKTSDDIDVGVAVLHGMASYTKDGKVVTGGVGDMTLVHADLGWRRVETDYGYAIEFETGEELRYGVVKEGVGSANINLDTLVLDGATGDSRVNILSATGHSRSVQISGGDGNDVLRRRRGMIPGWPGRPRAGGGLHVQCGSERPLLVAAKR
ncbi:MAG: hypothetical protein NTX73_10935 [Rhodobacterales bacterium]|nr:hypothetical protein [Rhodobacterales bacterium]